MRPGSELDDFVVAETGGPSVGDTRLGLTVVRPTTRRQAKGGWSWACGDHVNAHTVYIRVHGVGSGMCV